MIEIRRHLTCKERFRAVEFLLSAAFLALSVGLLLKFATPDMVEAKTSAPDSTFKHDKEISSHNVPPETSGKVAADPAVRSGPPDSVVALYFHRTLRCEDCLLMESYIKDVIKSDYFDALLKGSLRWHALDYEKPEHAESADKYQFGGPALILSHWSGGKEVLWARMDEIWDVIDYPEAVADTLRGQFRACLAGACRHETFCVPDTAGVRVPGDKTKESPERMGTGNDQR